MIKLLYLQIIIKCYWHNMEQACLHNKGNSLHNKGKIYSNKFKTKII